MNKVIISKDFDLKKIADSGQCFRAVNIKDDIYRFITKDNVLYIQKSDEQHYSISCTIDEWESVWAHYFDLDTDYNLSANDFNDTFLKESYKFSKGIRILRQDPFEMIISYIISQQKSIPQIKKAVESICYKYGKPIKTNYETVYTFPKFNALSKIDLKDLSEFKLGYRAKYIKETLNQISIQSNFLKSISSLSDGELFECLQRCKGIGPKVSSCICLFGYHRLGFVPRDVWVNKIINTYFNGVNKFEEYKNVAGVVQQYAYYYIRVLNER